MSLLIKALEKAEKDKGTDDKKKSLESGLSLAPIDEVTDETPSLEAQSGFINQAPASATKQGSQKAAATMFAAKTVQVNNNSSKMPLILGFGLVLLALLGGGFYYYLQSLTPPTLTMPNSVPTAPSVAQTESNPPAQAAPTQTDTPSTVSDMEQSQAFSEPKDESVQAPITAPKPEPKTANAQSKNDSDQAALSPQAELPINNEPLAKSNIKTKSKAANSKPVSIVSNAPENGVNPSLLMAYQAFNAGEDKGAQQLYRQVLHSDVRNIDALLGMAAIAARQGRANDALGWYGKVLEIEPRNSVAQASMVSLIGQADPVSSESKIKSLIAQQPQAAHLHAALGNFYAEQNQWPAAQQSYFEAYHLDAKNPDYAFNLAISLDQMGKNALALQYYKEALALLNNNAGNIDRAQLETRILKLDSKLTP